MKNEYKIAAAYIRVSTEEQLDFSPDAQLRDIREYCIKKKLILNEQYIFIDEGISGKDADNRPQFQRMIATAKTKPKPFDVILIHKFDRFSRNREDSIVYKSLLRKKLKIDVISIKEDVGTDKNGVLLEGMLDVLAEYYSINLADEVKKGQLEKVRQGGNVNCIATGYKKDGQGGMIIDESCSWWIKIIFEDYANGLGRRKIVNHLYDLGIRTVGTNKPISQDRIRYILNNPVYAGYVRRSKNGRIDRKFNSEKWLICKGIHEPIISEELWNRVQEINNKNLELYSGITKEKKHHWLLGRLVICSSCGGGLVKYKSRGIEYLQCAHYFNGQCKKSHCIKLERIEKTIIDQIKIDFATDIHINISKQNYKTDDSEKIIFIEKQLEKNKEKGERIKFAYINGIDSIIEYKQNKAQLVKEEKSLTLELKKLNIESEKKVDVSAKKGKIKKMYEILSDPKENDITKYEIAHIVFDKIVYDKDKETLFIYYN